jgi:nucleoid-associated protein YgaU
LGAELAKTKESLDAANSELARARSEAAASKELAAGAAKAAEEAASKAAQVITARAGARDAELASARQDLEAEKAAAEKAKADSAARIASLQDQLSRRSAEADSLASKVATDEAALKASGDSSGRIQALSTDLDQARRDLASTKEQLGDAQKAATDAKSDGANERAALEKQVADLTARLGAAAQGYAALQQENNLLRRSPPVRPSTAEAARLTTAPAPTPAPTPQVRTYVVVDGDTLSGISLKFYGTARRWPDIYQANRDILPNESVLRVGSTLRIP